MKHKAYFRLKWNLVVELTDNLRDDQPDLITKDSGHYPLKRRAQDQRHIGLSLKPLKTEVTGVQRTQ